MSTPILDYLVWPNIQSGRVTWAAGENTLANPDGTVFAFAEQVADFLEGFAAVRRIVHFALILRLLQVLRSPGEGEAGLRRLHTLFTQANGSLRNAGAFCGQLCSMAPAAREANEVAEICQRLRARDSLSAFLGIHTGTFLQMVAVGYRPPEMPPYAEMER
ncbi:MAG TPA: hypothetical protein VFE62_24865, partial [Gemmataceae bacterium]|nr:hypothetical protein [Gemmataceae bacterium]